MIMLMLKLAQLFMLLTMSIIWRILGIIMSSNCSFEQHIIELCKRCAGLCGWILRTFSSGESTVKMTLFKSLVLSQGVHLSFETNSPVGYWDYQIQSPTIISTIPQNCPIFAFIITYIIMYHAIKNRPINNYNYEYV